MMSEHERRLWLHIEEMCTGHDAMACDDGGLGR